VRITARSEGREIIFGGFVTGHCAIFTVINNGPGCSCITWQV